MSPAAFESFDPSGRRISRWWCEDRRRLTSQEPPEPDLRRRRLEQVAAADDEVDALTQVVDDDAEPVRPVAVAVTDGEVADGADVARARPDEPSIQVSVPPPSATRSTGPSSPRSRQPPGQPGPDHGSPCSCSHASNVVREQSQP